jgi:hypothetical protein
MYGHVIKNWVDTLITDGIRETSEVIRRDITRGIYFIYFSSRLEHFYTEDSEQITKISVSPNDVKHVATAPWSMLPRNYENALCGTLSGGWDKYKVPLEETDTYRRIKSAYENDDRHQLITSIQRHGYKEAKQTDGNTRQIGDVTVPDEIRVAVSRNGNLIQWAGGRHRLSAAQLLGIDEVPVIVVIWHEAVDREDLSGEFDFI